MDLYRLGRMSRINPIFRGYYSGGYFSTWGAAFQLMYLYCAEVFI